MADYQSDRTGASIDTVLDNADSGNIGKDIQSSISDMNAQAVTGFNVTTAGPLNRPYRNDVYSLLHTEGTFNSNAVKTQIAQPFSFNDLFFRSYLSGAWRPWRELYHDNGNGVTAAEAATAIKGAKDGNIGVSITPAISDALDVPNVSGFFNITGATINAPSSGSLIRGSKDTNYSGEFLIAAPPNAAAVSTTAWIRSRSIGDVYGSWQELYHTGNTSFASFNATDIPSAPGPSALFLGNNNASIISQRTGVAASTHVSYRNDNGTVGTIRTDGTSTSYNTTSDNRLKSVIGKPTDADIDAKFNDIYDTFTLFNWKNNPDGDAVWGFLAHDVIDKGLDFGSEGEGPRNLNIGDVYETIPEETEQRPVMETIADEDGNEIEQQATDEQGNLLFEEVVVKEAIEKRVTPAGVDQSKITAYLVPFAEMQRRRIDELESQLAALTQRLDAAGL